MTSPDDLIPRRLPPTSAERLKTIAARTAGGNNAGSTRWGRAVLGQHGVRQSPALSSASGGMERLAVGYRSGSPAGFSTTDKIYISSWTFTEEDESSGAITADADGIGIFAEGVYAVHLFVHAEGMTSADPSCVIIGFCDYFDPFTESFGCVTRGGDPSSGLLFPSTSRTYYHSGSGSGAMQPGLAWVNLDTTHISDILLEVQVQRIA